MVGKLIITFLMFILFILFLVFSITDNSSKEEKSIRVILNFGVFLIITSSVIFTVSSWNELTNNFKVVFLSIQTLVFLVFGFILRYLLKIKNTGNSLMFIGNILINVTGVFIGYINVFKTSFSLQGKYKYIYLGSLLLLDVLISLLLRLLNKSKGYLFTLLSIIPIPFLIGMQFTNDVIFSFMITSVFLLILNIIKGIIKDKKVFNIVNITFIFILSFIFGILCIYSLATDDKLFLSIPLIIMLYSLIINMSLYLINQRQDILSIFIIIYDFLMVNVFMLFSGKLLTSTLIACATAIVIYILSYLSKNKSISLTSLVTSYVLGLESTILVLFLDDYIILAPFIAFVFMIISILNRLKNENNTVILDTISRFIFMVMIGVSIIIQPQLLGKVKAIHVFLIISFILLIHYIVTSSKNSASKIAYLILFLTSVIIQTFICPFTDNIIYSVLNLELILFLYAYLYIEKKNKVFNYFIYLLFMFALILGFNEHLFYASIALLLINIIVCVIHSKKIKYAYLILCYIPFAMLINNIPNLSGSYETLSTYIISLFALVFPFIIFMRKLVNAPKQLTEGLATAFMSYVFLLYIFDINIYVALTLGISSILVLIFGYVLNYKSFIYAGYIFTSLTIIIQTVHLWNKLPWWIYILILGIILLVIALVKELNKNKKVD